MKSMLQYRNSFSLTTTPKYIKEVIQMSAKRYILRDEKKHWVLDLIEEYRERGYGIPVGIGNLTGLVEKKTGWGIFVNPLGEFSSPKIWGQLFQKDGYFEIWLRRNSPHFQRRFSIAHEIGHIISAWDWSGRRPKPEAILCRKWLMESEYFANEIAERLLLPKWAMYEYFRKKFLKDPYQHQLDLFCQRSPLVARLRQMAGVFQVPPSILVRRIKRLIDSEGVI